MSKLIDMKYFEMFRNLQLLTITISKLNQKILEKLVYQITYKKKFNWNKENNIDRFSTSLFKLIIKNNIF